MGLAESSWPVAVCPGAANLFFRLVGRQTLGEIGGLEGLEVEPMFRPGQPSLTLQAVVQRCGRVGREYPEDRQARRPGVDLAVGVFRDARAIPLHAEDERSDGVELVLGQQVQDFRILGGLVERLVGDFEAVGVDGLQAHEDPATAAFGDETHQLFVSQKVHADLSDPGDAGILGDHVAQQGFGPLAIDREVVIDEEDTDQCVPFLGQGLQAEQLVDDVLVVAEANLVSEEAGHGAEFTTVGAAPPGFHRYHVELVMVQAQPLEHPLGR